MIVRTVAAEFRVTRTTGVDAYHRGEYRRAWSVLYPMAQNGDPIGQYYVGAMFHFGQGTERDAEAAARWYRLAADQGIAGAQRNLGVLYEDGTGRRRDLAKAAKWYGRAAKRGDALAQHNLAALYSEGRGVAEDDAEAARLLTEAAAQGDAPSQVALALRCHFGVGVEPDPAAAFAWINVAVRHTADGDEQQRAAWIRDLLTRRIDAAARAQGMLRASRWRRGGPV